MKCQRCGALFSHKYDYCLNCISYGKVLKEQKFEYDKRTNCNYQHENILLSNEQQFISDKLVETDKDILVDAVCGAGKTEICLEVISKFLKEGKRVGFAIPRKEVVKDVGNRLKELFRENIVSILHGESIEKEIGDITVLTTHQCPKFVKAFDLLIIDEPDAFPYAGNLLLQKIVESSAKERIIYLSATPPIEIIEKGVEIVELNKRYHGRKHPMPIVIESKNIAKSVKELLLQNDKNIIFTPTIKLQNDLGKALDISYFVNSKLKTNSSIVRMLEMSLIKNVIATSTLERGVTIPFCNVIITYANHPNFSSDTIVQMCGRVNRKLFDDKCNVYIVCTNVNREIKKAIKEIERRNEL